MKHASVGFDHDQLGNPSLTLGQLSEPDLEESLNMGALDKAKNKVEDLGGKAKEASGKATGDKDTEREGKADQVKSGVKDVGEKVKDVFKK